MANLEQKFQAVPMHRVAEQVSECLSEKVELKPLDRIKEVPDATLKYLIVEKDGSARRVVLCSSHAGPDLVARGMKRAAELAAKVEPILKRHILRPLKQGEVDGCSYSVVPYYYKLSNKLPLWWLQRTCYGPKVMKWLCNVSAATIVNIGVEEVEVKVVKPLLGLAERPGLDSRVQRDLMKAVKALERGVWRPFHTMCHGDMWHGNVMIAKMGLGGQYWGPFVIIDWPGASMKGFPFYDFVRLALSFRFRGNNLSQARLNYCKSVSSEPEHSIYHLLAALADLGANLEHWPLEKYLRTVHMCYNLLADLG